MTRLEEVKGTLFTRADRIQTCSKVQNNYISRLVELEAGQEDILEKLMEMEDRKPRNKSKINKHSKGRGDYAGDCEINIDVQKVCKAGLKGIQLHGTLRVILEPLIRDVPLVGAITVFFIRKPVLEINWTGLTNLLDVPGLSGISDTMILDIIASYMVLPNRFTVPLIKDVSVAQLRFPMPHGVVRVHLEEAKNLIIKDTYLGGIVKGKSDPYGLLRVGTQSFRSKTIKENLNPKWNEIYEFIVHEAPGQDLEVDLYDEDPDKDDFLGSIVIDLGEVMKDRVVDEWFPLNDVKSGAVHLRLEWLSLTTNKENLRSEGSNNLSPAVLVIYLDNACNLPTTNLEYTNCEYASKKKNPKYIKLTKKAKGEPNAYVELSVGGKSQKSKMRYTSKDPVWEEAFTFFIKNAENQILHAEVKDDQRDCALGMLNIPLYRILQATDMTLDQKFHLEHSGSSSFIKMKIVLRILTIEEPDPNSVYRGLSALKKGPVSIKTKKKKGSKDESSPTVHKKSSNSTSSTQKNGTNENKIESKSVRKDSLSVGEKDSEPRTPGTPFTKAQNRHLFRKDVISSSSPASLASSTETLDRDHPLPNGSSLDELTFGEIQITVRYASLRNSLVVNVGGCRNLISCSNEGVDPYVRIYLLPDKSWSARKKTSVKKKTLNPQFDEKFEFHISLEEAKKRKLDIAVKNNKSFTSSERKDLGKVLIDLSTDNLTNGFTQWYELTLDGSTRS
ncbi:extended synaptotagmin-3-like [Protopterus annectens]|uniref:extended synaptotagmin-3-like n=1 Tax=Protopterus annectens TaxID=7888 RepID=UPI001CFAAC93|nr:extended synaptotagmin-3-like [Protopterus annectens]